MKSFLKLLAGGSLVVLCWVGAPAHAQTDFHLFHTVHPYNGNTLPLDPSKTVYGKTAAEVCAQRSAAEIMGPFANTPNIIFVGYLPEFAPHGDCGLRSLLNATSTVVITTPTIGPERAFCSSILAGANVNPNAPIPQICVATCPDPEKDAEGSCPVLRPKESGTPPICCGNPVNPGTGNKFQAETDLAAETSGRSFSPRCGR